MSRSGIDMLEEILKRLEELDQKINILDKNIKVIMNTTRITDLVQKTIDTPMDGWARAIPNVEEKIAAKKRELEKGFSNFKFEGTDASKTKQVMPKARRDVKNIMVKGKMLANNDGKVVSLANISVKIYDDSDKLVKETRTNRAGHWMSHLPPGKYVALFDGELNGKKLVPQNRNFEVPKELPQGQNDIEVV